MEPAIATHGLSKVYGSRIAVADLTLEVPRGSVFALLGPNGAGKTTTVEMLACLRKPTSGTARVLGYDVSTSPSEVRSRIGILPQSVAGHEALTVQETLRYFAALFDQSADVESLMAMLGLTPLAHQRFGRLSGGQRRRVGIAAALVNDPDVVFLDEPTAGLDPAARRGLWETLHALRGRGKVIFLTTHHIEEAERLADEVAILADGRLVARGTPHALARAHGGARTILLPACGTAGQEALARAGITSRLDARGDVLVSLEDKADVSFVLSTLEKGGIDLGDVQVRSASLESAYLSLVKVRAASAGDAS